MVARRRLGVEVALATRRLLIGGRLVNGAVAIAEPVSKTDSSVPVIAAVLGGGLRTSVEHELRKGTDPSRTRAVMGRSALAVS